MPFYERGPVRIHYEVAGSGFPLLLIPGGGLNSAFSAWQTAPFKPMESFKNDFRCICADLRNANPGQSSGPLEIDRPWDAYTDDQLGLMDHLGIREFLVMGFCIGGPMIHNLIRRAPERVVAAAMMQPSGSRPPAARAAYPARAPDPRVTSITASGLTCTGMFIEFRRDQHVFHTLSFLTRKGGST